MATDPTTERWRLWIAERAESFFLFARQCSRSEDDARDVLQEALAGCWQRCGGEIPDAALVYATIRRRAIDQSRSTASRARRETAHSADTELWFQPDFAASDTHQAVSEALRKLPEHLRETVTLKLWSDLTFPQIAEAAALPFGAAAAASEPRAVTA